MIYAISELKVYEKGEVFMNKEEVEAKLSVWLEKAKKYGIPEKMEELEKCIESNAKSLYQGAEVEIALDIMEKIENGVPMDEIAEEFSKNDRSNMTELARNIVLEFSERGADFYENTPYQDSNGDPVWNEEDAIRVENKRREVREIRSVRHAKAKEQGIDMPYNDLDALEAIPDWNEVKDLDDVISFMKEKQEHGIPCYVNFNGKKIYSFQSVEEINLAVTGVASKEEFDKRQEEFGKKN